MTVPGDDGAEEERAKLAARLETLKKDIGSSRPPPVDPSSSGRATAVARGVQGASEFVVAILLGGAIGLGIDYVAGTRPLFTIVFFFIGVAAAIVGIVRSASPKRKK